MTGPRRVAAACALAAMALGVLACGEDEEPATDGATTTATATTATTETATETTAATTACDDVSFTPRSDDGAFGIEARATDCATARDVARAARDVRVQARTARYSAEGFACVGRPTGDERALPGVRYRCTRGDAVVSFVRT